MKTITSITVILFFASLFNKVSAQSSTILDYEGVAKTHAGQPIANTAIDMRITARDYLDRGVIVYQETQNVTTNAAGHFKVLIGMGDSHGGFYKDTWADGDARLMKIEIAYKS